MSDAVTIVEMIGVGTGLLVTAAGGGVWMMKAVVRQYTHALEERTARLEAKIDNGITERLDGLIEGQHKLAQDMAYLSGQVHAISKDEIELP